MANLHPQGRQAVERLAKLAWVMFEAFEDLTKCRRDEVTAAFKDCSFLKSAEFSGNDAGAVNLEGRYRRRSA